MDYKLWCHTFKLDFVLSHLLIAALLRLLLTKAVRTMTTSSALNCSLAHYGTDPDFSNKEEL